MTYERGARPGRPRDVGTQAQRPNWFVDHPDGTVSFVVRRKEETEVIEHAFHAATDAAALAEYEEWSGRQYEKSARQAQRRSRWGPLGTGKMS